MKSLLGMWRPRALEGMAFNQSPASGRAEDIARARDLASGAESTRGWNVTSSMHRDKVFWRSHKCLGLPSSVLSTTMVKGHPRIS